MMLKIQMCYNQHFEKFVFKVYHRENTNLVHHTGLHKSELQGLCIRSIVQQR